MSFFHCSQPIEWLTKLKNCVCRKIRTWNCLLLRFFFSIPYFLSAPAFILFVNNCKCKSNRNYPSLIKNFYHLACRQFFIILCSVSFDILQIEMADGELCMHSFVFEGILLTFFSCQQINFSFFLSFFFRRKKNAQNEK